MKIKVKIRTFETLVILHNDKVVRYINNTEDYNEIMRPSFMSSDIPIVEAALRKHGHIDCYLLKIAKGGKVEVRTLSYHVKVQRDL